VRNQSQNNSFYTSGQLALAILAGWTSTPPCHRSLEALAAELEDLTERDAAARVTYARRAAQ
jgi:hypothetical protein